MSIESDSAGELYQYFLIEAPELLQTIEETLLSLIEEKTIDKVHTLMRSAHTLKGSAASVEQSTIQTIAHHLEDVFEALYPEELAIDRELGGLLLEGYDCLREPLSATLSDLSYDREAILEKTAAVFAQLQDKLGDFFGREATLPTSVELGFDVIGSIFADSIIQDLERLEEIIVEQNPVEIEETLRSQAEFFSDLGFTYDLPGLAEIAQTTLAAIDDSPELVIDIAIAALTNFHQARAAILDGDRQIGGAVSPELKEFVSDSTAERDFVFDVYDESYDESFFDDDLDELAENTIAFSPTKKPHISAIDSDANIASEQAAIVRADSTIQWEDSDSQVDENDDFDDDGDAYFEGDFFDESFFSDAIDDTGEMTIAFAPDMVTGLRHVTEEEIDLEIADNSQFSHDDSEDSSEIVEEVATLESAIKDTQFNANYYVPAKSPVEAILQSIAALNTPLVNSDNYENPLEQKNSSSDRTSSIILPSIKVAIEQLDRLNHTVGELFIKENQQNLQQDRLQLLLKETFQEFRRCQLELSRLGDWSEQQKRGYKRQQRKLRDRLKQGIENRMSDRDFEGINNNFSNFLEQNTSISNSSKNANRRSSSIIDSLAENNLNTLAEFDTLEMDVYSDFDFKLQTITESVTRLGNQIETIDRIIQKSFLDTSKRKQLLDIAQSELLQARMLPLSKVFNRFPRHVQQMVSTYQKPAKFKTIGGEVTIDKAIAEKLYEPLLHLIRNAYDHGLETPEIRKKQGKSEVGKITIQAYNRGNRTIIEVKDDGKGISLQKVLTKAIEKNLIEIERIETLSETQITDFLFQPGFSTASHVTDLSGRGVGLNVVKSQIKALDGTISVRSSEEKGTTFTLQLPLNITTSRLLLCEAKGIIYGILSTEVKKVINPRFEEIKQQPSLISDRQESFLCSQKGEQKELIPIRTLEDTIDYTYPIIPRQSSLLNTLIGKKEKIQDRSLLLVEAEGKQLCLQVERVLTEKELVIKSLNSLVALPSYIQGYSVLGDGNLSLVINPVELVAKTYHASNLKSGEQIISSLNLRQSDLTEMTITANKKSASYYKPSILVIEDSIVQRQSLVRILEKGNYDVAQASNGQEAISIVEKSSQIDLILSDVEMPVMNGFEFLIYCQSNFRFSQIPIVMVTTRSGQKHRQLALSLGAKHYITKPAKERELLQIIGELLSI